MTSDDGEHTSAILKKLCFPEVEREPQPASVVSKVSAAIQKWTRRLKDGFAKLEALPTKDEVQSKWLAGIFIIASCGQSIFVIRVRVAYASPTCGPG